MKPLNLSGAFFLAAAFSLTSLAGAAPWEEPWCPSVCSTTSCNASCRTAGGYTTCAAYLGLPANDYDSDGVSNAADNCICTANSNQADCDSDGYGDACDGTDNSWYRIQVGFQTCHLDVDQHLFYDTLENYYADTYKSACTGQTCQKKKLLGSANCFPSADMACCEGHFGYVDCHSGAWNFDGCGTPRCNF